jgi:hypothetical protein
MVAAPYNPEKLRLQETREHNIPWKKWGPYLSERHGAPCVKTTVAQATLGTIFLMIKPVPAPTVGAKTDLQVSQTINSNCALRLPCGMG